MKTIAFLALAFPFMSQLSRADVYFLPQNKEELDSIAFDRPSRVDSLVHVKDAKVAYFNRDTLERDLPFLKGKSDQEIEDWILNHCAYISEAQLNLNGIRQSPIPISEGEKSEGFRPLNWNRAVAIPISDGKTAVALIDLKGVGLSADSDEIKQQVASFHELKSKNDGAGISQLRIKPHSDGLISLGEAIAEVVRAEALQLAFDQYNQKHKTDFQTVEHYFILSLPFKILKDGNKTDSAALIGRQAHIGRKNFGHAIPNHLYVDIHGAKQTDALGSAVDMGGVFPSSPALRERFLDQNQIEALKNVEIMTNKEKTQLIFDPQNSKEWEYAHKTADSFLQGNGHIVYDHLNTMLGEKRPILEHNRRLAVAAKLKTMLSSKDRDMRQTAASALSIYDGADASLLFEKAFTHWDHKVRINAAQTLSSYKGADVPLLFGKAFTHRDPYVRNKAALALGHSKNANGLFGKLLDHSNPVVRLGAASGLTHLGEVDSYPSFEKALTHKDPHVRIVAARSLENYQGVNAHLLFKKALTDPVPEVRRTTTTALGGYKRLDAHLVFREAFTYGDLEGIRRAAIALLRQKPSNTLTLRMLTDLQSHHNPAVRDAVSSLISQLYPEFP